MSFIKLSGPQGKALADLAAAYHGAREGATVTIRTVFGHRTGQMCQRDALAYDGPFKGMMLISCERPGNRPTDMVIVAPDGEELHLTVL